MFSCVIDFKVGVNQLSSSTQAMNENTILCFPQTAYNHAFDNLTQMLPAENCSMLYSIITRSYTLVNDLFDGIFLWQK